MDFRFIINLTESPIKEFDLSELYAGITDVQHEYKW
jgi:hypothetical protein